MEYNSWTQAENYLLVERLSSSSVVEEWREVVEQVDESETFKTESYRLKARRKFAIAKNLPLADVDLEDVINSPQGLAGWAEMSVSVPGIEEVDSPTVLGGSSAPGTPAPTTGKKRASGDGSPEGKPSKKPKAKSAAGNQARQTEKAAKDMLCSLQRTQQIVDKVGAEIDKFPSEWGWAKPLLEDLLQWQADFQSALKPEHGDDLTEFVNDLKLSVISPSALRQLKKDHKDSFVRLMTLFVDRCSSSCEQTLCWIKSWV